MSLDRRIAALERQTPAALPTVHLHWVCPQRKEVIGVTVRPWKATEVSFDRADDESEGQFLARVERNEQEN